MAEVAGLVTGFVGVAPVFAKCIKSIRTFREVRSQQTEIPHELNSLVKELEDLEHRLRQLETVSTEDTSRLQSKLHTLNEGLVELLHKLPSSSDGKRERAKIVWDLRHWETDVEKLDKVIQGIKVEMTLCATMAHMKQMDMLSQLINTKLLDCEYTGVTALDFEPSPRPEPPLTVGNASRSSDSLSRRRRVRLDCRQTCCPCSCHQTRAVSQRFWVFEYTDWRTWVKPCDWPSCTSSTYKISLKVVSSQLGIPWAITAALMFSITRGEFKIHPSLSTNKVVRYTSPGFVAIQRLRVGDITFEEARTALVNLAHNDESFKKHVDPSGASYLEFLLRIPWCPTLRHNQFAIAEVLIKEMKATHCFDNKSFLINCARWIGEASHMELLEFIMEYGFDPTNITSLHVNEWPQPCDPNWISEKSVVDPFFIDYFTIICDDNQGCAGMSPLHEAVLYGSPKQVKDWCIRCGKDERNFLGQAPLHLAIAKPELVQILIDAQHDLDAVDAYGVTPMMYAAVYNEAQTVDLLIRAGANPFALDGRFNRTFLHYAAIRENWDLIHCSLISAKKLEHQIIAEELGALALALYLAFKGLNGFDKTTVSLDQILAFCSGVNFPICEESPTFQKNTLLYLVKQVEEIDALQKHGFQLWNYVNGQGQNALMSLVQKFCSSDVLQRLLDAGCDINLQDNSGHSTLHHLMKEHERAGNAMPIVLDNLKILVLRGANVLCRDNCKCSCSTHGCLPAAMLPTSIHMPWSLTHPSVISYLEWVLLVFENREIEEAKETVLALIRRAKHEALDMAHVCCQRVTDSHKRWLGIHTLPLPHEDNKDILEEESEFIQHLNQELGNLSGKDFDFLVRQVLLHFKTELEHHQQQMRKEPIGASVTNTWGTFDVDSKRDEYRYHMSPFTFGAGADLIRHVTSSICDYMKWLESQRRKQQSEHNLLWEAQYYRRVSWLYFLSSLFDISVSDIIRTVRSQHVSDIDVEFPKFMEEDVQHFTDSWIRWKNGQMDSLTASGGFADRLWCEANGVDIELDTTHIVDLSTS